MRCRDEPVKCTDGPAHRPAPSSVSLPPGKGPLSLRRRFCRWAIGAILALAISICCVNCAGRRALEREAASVPRDPETGIIRGAEPIRIDRRRSGACLLLHGWVSTPADFGDLPGALDGAGWDVYAPLHAGRGTEPTAPEGVTAQQLLGDARAHYAELRARYERVVLVGFSMGGTIATILATEQPADGLVLVAPFYGVRYRWYYVLPPRWWSALFTPLVRYADRSGRLPRVNRPEGRAEIITYGAIPTSAMRPLFELRDRAVERAGTDCGPMPVLLLYSTGDMVSAPAAMEKLFEKLAGDHKSKAVFERSDHYLLHDYDREAAIGAIVEFVGAP